MRRKVPAGFWQTMNHMAFAVAAALPAMVLIPLNFDAIHGYYAYNIPVAGATVDIYSITYFPVDDRSYGLLPFHSLNRTFVDEHVGSHSGFAFLIANIEPVDDETIRVDFADKNYTIFKYDGRTYQLAPPFSHTELIRVNQTFVAFCNNPPDGWHDGPDNSTGLVIYQYRGIDTHTITEVKQMLPTMEHSQDGSAELRPQGDGAHTTRTITLSPPKEIRVHKFLSMAAYTDGKMRCDYPQVIERTVDSMQVDPANFRAVLQEHAEARSAYLEWTDPARVKAGYDVLYEWYR